MQNNNNRDITRKPVNKPLPDPDNPPYLKLDLDDSEGEQKNLDMVPKIHGGQKEEMIDEAEENQSKK